MCLTEKSLGNIYALGANLVQLQLSQCSIRSLPPNIFYFIPNLQTAGVARSKNFWWTLSLDLTNNFLCNLPISLAHHGSLEEIYLTNNLFTSYPVILTTLPKLKHSDLLDLLFDEAKDDQEEKDENVTVSYFRFKQVVLLQSQAQKN